MKSDDLGDNEGAGNAAFMLDMAEDVSWKGGRPTFLKLELFYKWKSHNYLCSICKFPHLKHLIDLQVFLIDENLGYSKF